MGGFELESAHIPVMCNEVVKYMTPQEGEIYVDGTFGAGGYSRALLEAANCTLYAIDRDPDVQPLADKMTARYGKRFNFLTGTFGEMDRLLIAEGINGVHGVVLDIGVSSMQLDTAERGFSFMTDGPLDMRMSKTGNDACTLVNEIEEEELANILYRYGDEHKSRRIARRIVEERAKTPITRTSQLASIIRSAAGKKSGKIDTATKSFQALRIWVNDELGELERALDAAEKLLLPGGRLLIVSFHSLEDTIVKRFLQNRSGKKDTVSRHQIVQEQEEESPTFTLLKRSVIKPTEHEVSFNPRARSSRMRAACRTQAPYINNRASL